ncbi:unnamed protein product [Prorocentrum cordatum]|uniref:Major facilitator superfamily (MFS) profile domain-containing protein n=1 Tax=Prorocentrum cordatum TaxID=2364126 RepID=A0ABN9QZZ3_9DINO|nr:unnamed protein product [Polarella glacialis]
MGRARFRGGPRGQRLVAAAGLLQAPAVRLSLGGGACGAGRTGEVDCASSGRGSLPATAGNIASAVLAGSLVLFVLASTGDFKQFSQMLTGEHGRAAPRKGCAHLVHCGFAAGPPDASGGGARGARRPPARPIAAIMGLTVYRFYTGFLSATWLPYLLAMEGVDLWGENQALFMGIIKLLYGASILLNPLFGLLGDKAATMSHGLGRRIFVRAGILLAALGIFTCYFAASRGLFRVFLLGILAWRLGEGLCDVTTEAICPEMLPPEQFQLSSSIRAAMFLVGGFVGYVAVLVTAHLHYSWLYFGYMLMMLLCGLPALALMPDGGEVARPTRLSQAQRPLLASAMDAYLKPAQYAGGFPAACLSIFLFSCGSAPMFFLLLMLRDLVGIKDSVEMQMQFSLVSIDFFLSAAAASALNVMLAPGRGHSEDASEGQLLLATEVRRRSFQMTAASVFAFALVVALIPFLVLLETVEARRGAFYVLSALMGATFGSVYSRFQDCNWQLLPSDVETATAMGFSTMCKLLGAGLGNFVAGLVLDLCQSREMRRHAHADHAAVAYGPGGYAILCTACSALVFAAGVLVLTIPGRVAAEARGPRRARSCPRAEPARVGERRAARGRRRSSRGEASWLAQRPARECSKSLSCGLRDGSRTPCATRVQPCGAPAAVAGAAQDCGECGRQRAFGAAGLSPALLRHRLVLLPSALCLACLRCPISTS